MYSLFFLLSKFIHKMNISSYRKCDIHKSSKIGSFGNFILLNLDRYSYVGDNCVIVNTTIGSFCSIANNCIIGGASHPMQWVSTSPVFYSGRNILKKNFSSIDFIDEHQTSIGHDVWIGNNVLIKAGVTIGNGAVIGMGSVVTKNVPSYEVWAGNPAKKIKQRFDDNLKKKIEETNWYNLSDYKLAKLADYIRNPEAFLYKYNKLS